MYQRSKPDGQVTLATAGRWAAVYCRFSVAVNGQTENVEDQERWGRQWAAARYPGLPVRVYVDNDKSAARDDVVRPDFDRLKADAVAGCVAVAWASESTRFERRPGPWFQLLDDWASHGVKIETKRDGELQADDLLSEMLGVINRNEIRVLRRRLQDKVNEHAKQGRPSGGRSFGYVKGTDADGRKTRVVVPEQAEQARWMASEVLDGRSTYAIAQELKAKGVRGVGGALISTPKQVETILLSPTIAGLRTHKGTLRPAIWEAILPEDQWHDVCAVIHARREKTTSESKRGGVARRKHLLTGSIWCERCAVGMMGTRVRQSGNRPHTFVYMCKNCGTTILLAETEDVVFEALGAKLANHVELANQLTADDSVGRREEIHRSLEAVEARRRRLNEEWAETDDLDETDWQQRWDALNAKRDRLQTELAELATDTGDDPDAALHALGTALSTARDDTTSDDDRRRAGEVLRQLLADWGCKVSIAPAVRGQKPHTRITVTFA